MKKKLLAIIVVFAIIAVAGYNMYSLQSDVKISNLAMSNIEALANPGEHDQPDVKDCISDEDHDCIALHPTDSSKDQVVPKAIWP